MAKFLIIRLSSIGDIVLTSPVVRCIKEQAKDAEVHFLVKEEFRYTVDHNPFIDKRIYLGDDLSSVIQELKKEKYDYIIDLHHNFRTVKIKRSLDGPSFSFRKLNIEKWLMVNFKIDRLPRIHIVDRYFETVKKLGVINDSKGLDFFIDPKDEIDASTLPPGFQNGYTGFVIGAKHFTKQLPKEKIAAICRLLQQPVILLGGKSDYEKGAWIINTLGSQEKLTHPVFNACGKYNLGQSASLVKLADVIITHDTGLMHIAAAFKKKIISLWGNTIPEFGMYPYYGNTEIQNSKFEIQHLYCRPCTKIGFDKCPKGHFKCMNLLDEAAIAAMANSYYKI